MASRAWPGRGSAATLAAVVLSAGIAHAGAWTEPAGRGQAIFSIATMEGADGFAADGGAVGLPPYRKLDATTLIEYGWTDWLTLIADPELLSVTTAMPHAVYDGFGQSAAGARLRLWHNADAVLSLQGTVALPGTSRLANPAQLGAADVQTDWRVLYGKSFSLGRWTGFTDMEFGYRTRAGAPADEVHLDVTLGVRPMPRLTLMLQSFTTATVGPARAPFLPGRWTKLEASVVYDITRHWSVQAGALTTVLGVNALRERGFVAAIWRRF